MAKRSSKNKKIRLAAIAAALSTGGIVIALLPSANADQKAPQVSAKNADALVEAESFDNVMVKAPSKFASVRFGEPKSCINITGELNSGKVGVWKGVNTLFYMFKNRDCKMDSGSNLSADDYLVRQSPAPGQKGSELTNWWVDLTSEPE